MTTPLFTYALVHPNWIRRSKPPRKRILKTGGVESLKKKLNGGGHARKEIAFKIQSTFSNIGWSKAESRADMNTLWEKWLMKYNCLVEELIGTRWARVSSWVRKFNSKVRELCIEASIARSWYVEAKRAGGDLDTFFANWKHTQSHKPT